MKEQRAAMEELEKKKWKNKGTERKFTQDRKSGKKIEQKMKTSKEERNSQLQWRNEEEENSQLLQRRDEKERNSQLQWRNKMCLELGSV